MRKYKTSMKYTLMICALLNNIAFSFDYQKATPSAQMSEQVEMTPELLRTISAFEVEDDSDSNIDVIYAKKENVIRENANNTNCTEITKETINTQEKKTQQESKKIILPLQKHNIENTNFSQSDNEGAKIYKGSMSRSKMLYFAAKEDIERTSSDDIAHIQFAANKQKIYISLNKKIQWLIDDEYTIKTKLKETLEYKYPSIFNSDEKYVQNFMDNNFPAIMQLVESYKAKDKIAFLLSIDGGGIRGIIPLQCLTALENYSDKKMSQFFHLISGTSTGGIIATLLSVPKNEENTNKTILDSSLQERKYTTSDILNMYETCGKQIFSPSPFFKNFFGLFGPQYQESSIQAVMDRYLGLYKLSDLANDVIISKLDFVTDDKTRPSFFKSYYAKLDPNKDYYLYDVARATSAAPTYFKPHIYQSIYQKLQNEQESTCSIDGGIFANNPAQFTLTEAINLYPKCDGFFLMSLGTGSTHLQKNSEEIEQNISAPNGILKWAISLPDMMIDSADEVTRHILKANGYLYNKKVFYSRVNPFIEKAHSQLDNVSQENIQYLKSVTDYDIQTQIKLQILGSLLRDISPVKREQILKDDLSARQSSNTYNLTSDVQFI